jgi:hypothetical protein
MSRMLTMDWTAPRFFRPPQAPLADGPGDEIPADRALWVLALGIVSLLIGPLGIIAWMAGNSCLRAIDDGRMDPICESNAKAGRLLGLIAITLFACKFSALSTFLAFYYW